MLKLKRKKQNKTKECKNLRLEFGNVDVSDSRAEIPSFYLVHNDEEEECNTTCTHLHMMNIILPKKIINSTQIIVLVKVNPRYSSMNSFNTCSGKKNLLKIPVSHEL